MESLLDQSIIQRNMPHFFKAVGDKVIGPVFLVHFLPFLEFLISKQVFFGRVVGLVMSG